MNLNKKLVLGTILVASLAVFPAESFGQADITLNMTPVASLSIAADCDGGGSTTVTLAWNGATKTGTGSCNGITVSWLQATLVNMRVTATLTAALTDGTSTIPAADHSIKIVQSGNAWNGTLLAQTTYAALGAAVSLWEEDVDSGEQNRSDTFQVDFQVNGTNTTTLTPGNLYTGTVQLTVATF